jgi:heme/copper-type cytochrome/quinol oxidase subunit 4
MEKFDKILGRINDAIALPWWAILIAVVLIAGSVWVVRKVRRGTKFKLFK